MNCLVTGGAGFIGSHLADSLLEKGHKVIIIDDLSSGKIENVNKKSVFYNKSILDSDLLDLFKKENIEVIFHLAAQKNVRKSIEDPLFDAKANIIGTLNILEAARKSNVKKIIFSSTGGAIYGDTSFIPTKESASTNPESPYGVAKLTIEKYLYYYYKTYGLNYTILRYSNVYGPRQDAKGEAGVIAIFIENLIAGKELNVFGDGEQTRDYIYVKDVVKANILAIKEEGTYNVGTSKETSLNEIIEMLKSISKKDCVVKNLAFVKGELRRSCLDISSIKEKGFIIEYDLKKGLLEMYSYMNKNE